METIRSSRPFLTFYQSFSPASLRVHVHPLVVVFACLSLGAKRLLCFSALFLDVLEKTVEGEAAALTQAKTLYKSCTNERKSAGPRKCCPCTPPAFKALYFPQCLFQPTCPRLACHVFFKAIQITLLLKWSFEATSKVSASFDRNEC